MEPLINTGKETRVAFFKETAGEDVAGEYYKELPIFAFAGLHGRVGERASAFFSEGARVLDLASGSGALALRIRDLGFDVECCEAVPEGFRLHGDIPITAVDLDGDFAERLDGPFDAITAVEIIEHLENPWHFLRQCAHLLKPGGRMILTTPNIDTPRSILSFVKFGTFKFFTDGFYEKDGHITPVSQWQLEKCIREAGLKLNSLETFGAPWGAGLRHLGAKALWLLANKNPRKIGTKIVALIEKPATARKTGADRTGNSSVD